MPEFRPGRPESNFASRFWEQLGIPSQGIDLIELVRAGFAITVLKRLSAVSAFSEAELTQMMGLSRYALRQGRRSGRLSMLHSDRLYRTARVIAAAVELYDGNQTAARRWLFAPQLGLGGRSPVTMCATEIEGKAVLDLLGRLETGVVI